MKLYIDTSQSETITIRLNDLEIVTESKKEKAQKLLEVIAENLEKKEKNIHDIEEIEVVLGPGSFTGLRVGVSVANTLAWTLGIPVNGKKQIVTPIY